MFPPDWETVDTFSNFLLWYIIPSAMWPQAFQTHQINTAWPLPKFRLHSLLHSSHTTHTAVRWTYMSSSSFQVYTYLRIDWKVLPLPSHHLHIVSSFPFLRPPLTFPQNSTDNPSLAPYLLYFLPIFIAPITIWKCITYWCTCLFCSTFIYLFH